MGNRQLVCAGLALAVMPVVFEPLDIAAGAAAAWKGAERAGVTASFVAAVVSIYVVARLST